MAILQAKTEYGIVEGLPGGNQANTIFKGIPFVKAPVGDLRWKAPQPPEPWEGVYKAYKFAPIAMQPPMASEGGGIIATEFYAIDHPRSEDCLYLNVWTPAKSPDEKLPVGIYVHGGGYNTGYSYLNCYDGEGFNKRGIVFVTIPYRINVFGCLAHPELTAESGGHGSGNYGPLDQVEAIKWVKRNIAAFGGDPDNITLFGQSAGGRSTYTLCCSPLTEGLIQHAIMQSGGGLGSESAMHYPTLEEAEQVGISFFDFMGYKSLAEARAADAMDIYEGYVKFTKEKKARFGMIVDGYVLPESQRDITLAGKFHDIDYMIGSAADEGMGRTAQAIAWCENQLILGKAPSFTYYFSYVPPGAENAHHSVEHHYVFQTLVRSHRPYTGFDWELSNELADYWSNFIKTGNPNYPGETKWTPYTKESPMALEIGKERKMIEIPRSPELQAEIDKALAR